MRDRVALAGPQLDGEAAGTTAEQTLVMALAAGVALTMLCALMAFVHRHHVGELASLLGLARDGLLGQARNLVPLPIAGTNFEVVVHALDRGDGAKARGAFQRMLRRSGRVRVTGWSLVALVPAPLVALPLVPVGLHAAVARLDGVAVTADLWAAVSVALLAVAALTPVGLLATALAAHLGALEYSRRLAAAAGLLQHSGKELR